MCLHEIQKLISNQNESINQMEYNFSDNYSKKN